MGGSRFAEAYPISFYRLSLFGWGEITVSFLENSYGPVLAELLETDRNRPLDEGMPDEANRARLEALSVDDVFAHTRVLELDQARCCLAGMWLLYDFLDESHTISQGIGNAEGSFWHAIMHRREGDFSNAKYWFRNVGAHPMVDLMAIEAAQLPPDSRTSPGNGGPCDFVDDCQAALQTGRNVQRCRELQQREWELLFDFCYRNAIGK